MSKLPRPKPDFFHSFLRFHGRVCFWLLFLTAAGCASYGEIKNTEIATIDARGGYSLREWRKNNDTGDITLILTFSGGGT